MSLNDINEVYVLYRKMDLVHLPEDMDMVDYFGMYSKKRSKIYISSDLSPELKLDTILHEIGHAIDYEFKITGSMDCEHFANSFATAMFSLFKENPELITAMAEMLYPKEQEQEQQEANDEVLA
jgi:Zn-dependent peptidase ImmA (M78 family)